MLLGYKQISNDQLLVIKPLGGQTGFRDNKGNKEQIFKTGN